MPLPPPLAVVDAVLARVAPSVAALPEAADLVSESLDGSALVTPPRAAAWGSHRLFDRVAFRVSRDAVDAALRSHWLSRAMEVALKNDDLLLAQKIHRLHPEPFAVWPLQLALESGSLETVQWVVEHRNDRMCCAPGVGNLCYACLRGCFVSTGSRDARRIVEWLTSRGPLRIPNWHSLSDWALFRDVLRRSVDLVRWFDEQQRLPQMLDRVLREALYAKPPSLLVVRYLMMERSPTIQLSREEALRLLISDGSSGKIDEIVELVLASPSSESFRDMVEFAPNRAGGSRVLQWDATFLATTLLDGQPLGKKLMENVQHHGSFDTVRSVVRDSTSPFVLRIPTGVKTDREAVEFLTWVNDSIHSLHMLSATRFLAERGFVTALQFLHENFARDGWYTHLLDVAAANGHLHVVQWILKNRGLRNGLQEATLMAAQHGHLALVKWLSQNFATTNANEMMVCAAQGGHLEVLSWLYEHGINRCTKCVVHDVLRNSFDRNGFLPPLRFPVLHTLAWLESRLTPSPVCVGSCVRSSPVEPLAVVAAKAGDVTLLAHLRRHHPELLTPEIFDIIGQAGHSTALFPRRVEEVK